jgi:hypothetical protein
MFKVTFSSIFIIGIPVFSGRMATISGPCYDRGDATISLRYNVTEPTASGCTVEELE